MNLHPVLLDSRPSFLARGDARHSLLLLPVGRERLLSRLVRQLRELTSVRPIVVPTFQGTVEYVETIHAHGLGATAESAKAMLRRISALDPAEEILFIDPASWPSDGFDQALVGRLASAEQGLVRHLVALERTSGATKEFVHSDIDGRVRKIQRYYHPQTWPFASGIVCSVVPVASLSMAHAPALTSLTELRHDLTTHGVPSQDIPFADGALDLRSEEGVLHLVERSLRDIACDPVAAGSAGGARVSTTGRIVGHVIMEEDVHIEAGALVIGPTFLGSGSRIGSNAVVAQCLVLPGVSVTEGAVLRHRVVATATAGEWSDRHPKYADTPLQSHSRNVVSPGEPVSARAGYRTMKRLVESTVAGVALVLLAPLMAAIAIGISVLSPGPVFFGHAREGKGGRPFRCWKFRTMRVGADAAQRELAAQQQLDGPQFKIDRDPRVTAVGRFLRASNLDELPQLWNVVKGEMSLVGPRPSPFRENQVCVPWRQGRLSVLPGITGLWQVCRHDRAAGDFHQWIEYDLLYVRHMSPMVDLRILAATILTLGGKRPVALARIVPAAVGGELDVQHDVDIGSLASEANLPASPRFAQSRSVRRSARALSVALCCLSVPSARATAQRNPGIAPPATGRWMIAIASQTGVETNPAFLPGAHRPDASGGVWGAARNSWSGRGGRLSLAATGSALRHRRLSALDRYSYDGRVEYGRDLAPRTEARLGYRAQSQLARDILPATGETLIPLARATVARSHDADGWLEHRLSSRARVDVRGRLHRIAYDAPTLTAGSSGGGQLNWVTAVSRVMGIGAGYEFEQSSTGGQSLASHVLHGTWNRAIDEVLDARLTAGIARLDVTGAQASDRAAHWAPSGAAEVAARYRSGTFLARYQRRSSQLLGPGGVVTTDFISVRADRTIGRSLSTEAGAHHSMSRNIGAPVEPLRARGVFAGVAWMRRNGFVTGASFFHHARSQVIETSTSGVMVSMGYGWSGGRIAAIPLQGAR